MARLTDEDRENILADYHTGEYSNNELAKKYVTSHTTINKITKGLQPKHKDKVSTLVAIKTALAGENFKEVSAVETLVEKKTAHLKLINDNATKLANKISMMADQIDTPIDLKTLVDANDRLAITLKVADRHAPKSDVNVNTQTNVQANSYSTMTKEEMIIEAKKRGLPLDAIGL